MDGMTRANAEVAEDQVEEGAVPEGPHPLADIQPGIYGDIPEDLYHSGPGVSNSTLKRLAEAPIKAITQRDETPALRFGTLTHLAILQPELLADRYHVVKLARLNPKDGAYKEAKAIAGDRELVRQPDWDDAMRISEAVRRNPTAREILSAGLLVEQSGYWVDPETGLLCRSRMDILRPDMGVIADLKSAADASYDGFAKAVANNHYDWQAAHYLEGIAEAPNGFVANAFLFIAVEKEAPYCVGIYELEPEDIVIASEKVHAQLRRYAECARLNEWPGYPANVQRLQLPAWYRRAA